MSKEKYVFVADGEVFMKFTLDTDASPAGEMWSAGLKSNPTIIQVDKNSPVDSGWTYDGTNFTAPENV
jgi:hypothetical protein